MHDWLLLGNHDAGQLRNQQVITSCPRAVLLIQREPSRYMSNNLYMACQKFELWQRSKPHRDPKEDPRGHVAHSPDQTSGKYEGTVPSV